MTTKITFMQTDMTLTIIAIFRSPVWGMVWSGVGVAVVF